MAYKRKCICCGKWFKSKQWIGGSVCGGCWERAVTPASKD